MCAKHFPGDAAVVGGDGEIAPLGQFGFCEPGPIAVQPAPDPASGQKGEAAMAVIASAAAVGPHGASELGMDQGGPLPFPAKSVRQVRQGVDRSRIELAIDPLSVPWFWWVSQLEVSRNTARTGRPEASIWSKFST